MDFLIKELESAVDLKSEENYSVEKIKYIIEGIFQPKSADADSSVSTSHQKHTTAHSLDQFFTSAAPIDNRSLLSSAQPYTLKTTQPQTGTIVNEIAELDNMIKLKETEIGKILFEDIDDLTSKVVGAQSKKDEIMGDINGLLDTLQNVNNDSSKTTDVKGQPNTNNKSSKELEQEFKDSLEMLKSIHANNANGFYSGLNSLHYGNTNRNGNISLLLNNLEDLNNRLLEIPTLVSKCIKTGHYNEALMLQQHCKYTLRSKMIGFGGVNRGDSSSESSRSTVDSALLINKIVEIVDNEIKNKMMYGLVILLERVDKFNSLKKILNYLINIESDKPIVIASIFLVMRFRHIQNKIDVVDMEEPAHNANKLRRRIDLLREEMYSTITIYNNVFDKTMVNLPHELFLENYYIPSPLEISLKTVLEKNGSMCDEEIVKESESFETSNNDMGNNTENNTDNSTDNNTDNNTDNSTQNIQENQNTQEQKEEIVPIDTNDYKKDINESFPNPNDNETKPLDTETIHVEKKENNFVFNPSKNSTSLKPPISTNTQILEFVNNCLNLMFRGYSTLITNMESDGIDDTKIEQNTQNDKNEIAYSNKLQYQSIFTDSILLQLIYCSFRLNDINVNYHNLMLNKILNLQVYRKDQLLKAIDKRRELSLSY